jgi:hypothetical protein
MTDDNWSRCTKIYPPPKEIAQALQDMGKGKTVQAKKKEVKQHSYPLVDKMATKIYKAIQEEFKPEGLTSNISRGKQFLVQSIILARRHVDISETHPFFRQFGKDGKVYQISNSPDHSGLDTAIQRFQENVVHTVKQKNSARTGNDALRLGCILLDPKYRGSVTGIMSKKKDRKKSDITGDPVSHFFE